jgi:predicted SprT family Zn-dependent metalloprotease
MSPKHQAIENLTLKMMQLFKLRPEEWKFRWNRRTRQAAICRYPHRGNPGFIELSYHYVELNPLEDIYDTIKHEIAHALTEPTALHGPEWIAACAITGARPQACCSAPMPMGKWQATCGRCKTLFDRHKKPGADRQWWCKACGSPDGLLDWKLA